MLRPRLRTTWQNDRVTQVPEGGALKELAIRDIWGRKPCGKRGPARCRQPEWTLRLHDWAHVVRLCFAGADYRIGLGAPVRVLSRQPDPRPRITRVLARRTRGLYRLLVRAHAVTGKINALQSIAGMFGGRPAWSNAQQRKQRRSPKGRRSRTGRWGCSRQAGGSLKRGQPAPRTVAHARRSARPLPRLGGVARHRLVAPSGRSAHGAHDGRSRYPGHAHGFPASRWSRWACTSWRLPRVDARTTQLPSKLWSARSSSI